MKISDNVEDEIQVLHIYKYLVCLLNILCQQQCKDDVSKRTVAAMRFTIKEEYLIKCLRTNKTYDGKCFFKMFYDRRWCFVGLKH